MVLLPETTVPVVPKPTVESTEMIEDPINKIGRPRQLYTGYNSREYQIEASREKKSIFNWLWKKD